MTNPDAHNWYTKSVEERYPIARQRCEELMSEKQFLDLVCDTPAGGLLAAMEEWLKEYDATH